jgi:hypothetical protein
MTSQTELVTFIRTLLGAGLTITNVSTKPNFTVVNAERFDEFKLSSRYVFIYCTSPSKSTEPYNATEKPHCSAAGFRRAL